MSETILPRLGPEHSHVFLGQAHARNERRAWMVIGLCTAMMVLEIVGGLLFGSIALVADGLHMSTHAGALLLAALAYTFARRFSQDERFTFGTGKLGDLAGFTSAIVLAMIALLIGWEAVMRIFHPTPIRFGEAIPIAGLGLAVNMASAWLLGGGHEHGHGHHHHGHAHAHDARDDHAHAERMRVETAAGPLELEIFEDGAPPRFRLSSAGGALPAEARIETLRPDGSRQGFAMVDRGGYLESADEIPEPHAFTAEVALGPGGERHRVAFEEHGHDAGHVHQGDNNMRAALVHVLADAAVSVLVILGLVLARLFGWLWMDPLAGMVGAVVIASWSVSLIRDTGAVLLDMCPDRGMADRLRQAIEAGGDEVADLHLWRLGPGHLGAILAVRTDKACGPEHFRAQLARFTSLSHLTIEVASSAAPPERRRRAAGAHG